MTWTTAQLWLEKRAIIDGDSLTVLTTGKDGGGSLSLFSAPQITSNRKYDTSDAGVIVDSQGRAKAYNLFNYATEKSV